MTNNVNDADGIANSPELSYVLGLDWSGLEDTFISAQLFQSWVIEATSGITRDKLDTTMTLLLRRTFLYDTLTADVLLLQSINQGDGLLRPKITYNWQDNLTTWIGADIFYGNKDALFGEFGKNSRVQVGLELAF